MVDYKMGMLVYEHHVTKTRCNIRVPEILDNLWLSYIEVDYIDICLASRHIHYVDMSTQQVKVYKIRLGSQSEFYRCQMI